MTLFSDFVVIKTREKSWYKANLLFDIFVIVVQLNLLLQIFAIYVGGFEIIVIYRNSNFLGRSHS